MLIPAKKPIDHRTFSAFRGNSPFIYLSVVRVHVLSANIARRTDFDLFFVCFFKLYGLSKFICFKMAEGPDG